MTQPDFVAPFTSAALAAALPEKEPASAAPPAAPTAAPETATEAAPETATGATTPEPSTYDRARQAADRLVAKRKAQRQADAQREARMRGLESQAAADRQAREAAERQARRVETETLQVMREKGITDKMVAQAHIDDQSPEGRMARLEAELKAERAERQREAQARQQEDASAGQRAQQQEYLRSASAMEGDAPRYPHIAAMAAVDPRGVIRIALDLVDRARAQGKVPTNADLLETQEWLYSEAAAKATKASKAATPPAAVPPAATQPSRKPATASLTGRKVPPPAVGRTFGQMSRDEQLAHMAAQLKKTAIEV